MSLALVLVAHAALAADTANANPWEEVNDDDGITVWAREVAGSKVREVKAVHVIDAAPERVWEVLGDVTRYVEFMPYVVETQVIAKEADGHYEYQRIDPPFVDERDYCVRVKLEKNAEKGIYKRTWTEANDKAPPLRDGTVRVPVNRGSWTLESAGPNKTKLTYYLFTDPGGSIPAWISNKANTTSLPDLLAAVKSRALNPSWKRD